MNKLKRYTMGRVTLLKGHHYKALILSNAQMANFYAMRIWKASREKHDE